MSLKVYSLLLLLSAKWIATLQSPTAWKALKETSNVDALSEADGILKYASKSTDATLFSQLLQALCKLHVKASNLVNWKNMNLSNTHIDSSALVQFNTAKRNTRAAELKRTIHRRSSKDDSSFNPEKQNDTEAFIEADDSFYDIPSRPGPGILGEIPKSSRPSKNRNMPPIPTGIKEESINRPLHIPNQMDGERDIKREIETLSGPGSSKNGGIGNWVFISIGVTVAVVGVSLFLLSYMYRTRMAQPQSRGKLEKAEEEQENADSLLRTVSLQGYSGPSDADCIPMHLLTGNIVSCEDDHMSRSMNVEPLEVCYASSKLLPRCVSIEPEENKRARAESTGSIYNMIKNDGNKLRGGNVDFHRRYVNNPYLSEDLDIESEGQRSRYTRNSSRLQSKPQEQHNRSVKLASSSSESGWNGSSASSTISHHSARSYISIAPTSPSGNYVEAGFDCMPLVSQKSSTPVKMEWLTKSFSLDRKNELSTYQTSTGVQTEESVSAPTSKTVLGTAWQFGGAFANQGGVLQARGSDVVLSVPAGAVARGQAIDIYGAIFTNTADIRRKLEFSNDESLVTPVVEYLALPVNDFNKPMHLHLPHSLPSEFDRESVKVYTFSVDELGHVTTSCLPLKAQAGSSVNQEAFWEKNQDGSKIIITTSHFSGYFCTLCESTSLPSICTMVFGSHVQISQHRREIRVILYIWDRRLTIRDYLERFQKQESEVDRQLLTDMQVPLLNNASSDSRLVMRMEIMGGEEDRQCWRHVSRPGGSRLLFKPLQVRRLSEIVHCCRQTDPVRVEWALENRPDVAPGPVFQCCIDILHTPESISDYESALSEDLDDLMRTFYVRDLKVMSKEEELTQQSALKSEPTALKRTLSEALDLRQTEQLCLELGITSKDIGNFHKKFSTDAEVQIELVEECLERLGHEKFVSQLPHILDKLHMSHLLRVTGKEDSKQLILDAMPPLKHVSTTKDETKEGLDSSITACKSVNCRANDASKLSSSGHTNINMKTKVLNQKQLPTMQHPASEKSDDVFVHASSPHGFDCQDEERAFGDVLSSRGEVAAPSLGVHHAVTNNKLNSSSGYVSVNQQGSSPTTSSSNLHLTHSNNLHSFGDFSVVAHANTLEMPQSSVQSPPERPGSESQAYPEIMEELCVSTSGPQAFVGQRLKETKDSNLSDHRDETSKKEMYGIHTVV